MYELEDLNLLQRMKLNKGNKGKKNMTDKAHTCANIGIKNNNTANKTNENNSTHGSIRTDITTISEEQERKINEFESKFLNIVHKEAKMRRENKNKINNVTTSAVEKMLVPEDKKLDVVNRSSEMTNRILSISISEINILPFSNVECREPPKQNKRKRNNVTLSNENEDIDDVSVAESSNLASASSMTSNQRKLSLRKKKNRIVKIDLSNATNKEDSIIEISDSPDPPRVISEVINIDDDNDNISIPTVSRTLGSCPICLTVYDKYTELMSTICGHVYCTDCIKTVIKTRKKCPICRKYLTLKSIHPLFI